MPSTVIAGFEYNEKEKSLVITFLSGKKYRYLEVPMQVYLAFRAARSKGIYFNTYIKDVFAVEKI